ncbi:MAG: hypothetical protein LBO72_09485 [Helicobacteraceae bacterium]|jgi:hypothetical protein|nr:hypothetical protein [Helicobacteraceae bacterium]
MDLKEMVLSALADLQEENERKTVAQIAIDPIAIEPIATIAPPQEPIAPQIAQKPTEPEKPEVEQEPISPPQTQAASEKSDDEAKFLSAVKERILALFEGFQSPNNKAVEAKVDLTLNFFEYLLSAIEERIDELERR